MGRSNQRDPEHLLETGDYEAAIEGFRAKLAKCPSDPMLRGRLGEAYQRAGNHERAFYHFDQTARSFLNMGKDASAVAFLQRADEVLPEQPEVLYRLAQCHEGLGQTEALIPVCERLEACARADGDRRRLWALERLVTHAPQKSERGLALAQMFLRFNRVEKALQVLHSTVRNAPKDPIHLDNLQTQLRELALEYPKIHQSLAQIKYQTLGAEAVIRLLEPQSRTESLSVETLELLCDCYRDLQQHELLRETQLRLTAALVDQDRSADALPIAEELSQHTEHLEALQLAARVFSAAHNDTRAAEIWRQVLLGYHGRGDVKGRERALIECLRSSPNAPSSLRTVALILRTTGRSAQAETLEERIKALPASQNAQNSAPSSKPIGTYGRGLGLPTRPTNNLIVGDDPTEDVETVVTFP